MTEISEDEIRLRAYALWESDGRPAGSHDVHWLQALRELTEEAKAAGGAVPEKRVRKAKPPVTKSAAAGSTATKKEASTAAKKEAAEAPASRKRKTS